MKTHKRLAAFAALFTISLFAADPVAKPASAVAIAPTPTPADELAITKLLRRIDHNQIVIDQTAAAQKDQQEAQVALRALVVRVSPPGYHLTEPTPGEL